MLLEQNDRQRPKTTWQNPMEHRRSTPRSNERGRLPRLHAIVPVLALSVGQLPLGRKYEDRNAKLISSIVSTIVTLDSQEPSTGQKKRLDSILDFACGSGSMLLNVRQRMGKNGILRFDGGNSS